jgi:drug/metabolite transporter (DMT)-like permease
LVAGRRWGKDASVPVLSASADRSAVVFGAGLVVTWASAFAAIRAGLEGYDAVALTAGRLGVASLAFLVAAPWLGLRLPPRTHWPRLVACGFFGQSAYHLLLNLGEQEVTAATAALLIATAPVFVALLSRAVLAERIPLRRWLGIAVAAAGVVLVAGEGGGGLRVEPAALLVLGAASCAAIFAVVHKPLLVHLRPIETTAWSMWVGTILVLPFAGGLLAGMRDAPADATVAMVYLGVVPSAIGYLCFAAVLSRLEASAAAVLLYLIPPVAALIAWVWLGEALGILTAVGGALTLVGVAVASGLRRPVCGEPPPTQLPESAVALASGVAGGSAPAVPGEPAGGPVPEDPTGGPVPDPAVPDPAVHDPAVPDPGSDPSGRDASSPPGPSPPGPSPPGPSTSAS